MKAPFLLGRLIFGSFFLYNGINHLRHTDNLAQYAKSKGVPWPEIAVMGSGIALIVGGASILSGIRPKIGTLAVMSFLAGVSPVMHDFWGENQAEQKQNQMIHFMKNLALFGGALALMGVEEPWPVSIPIAQPGGIERAKKFSERAVAA